MPATMEDTDTLEELFSSLDDHIPCSYHDCQQTAANLLKCPCADGAETICAEHTALIREQQKFAPHHPIRFDGTCQHMPRIGDCLIVAI